MVTSAALLQMTPSVPCFQSRGQKVLAEQQSTHGLEVATVRIVMGETAFRSSLLLALRVASDLSLSSEADIAGRRSLLE